MALEKKMKWYHLRHLQISFQMEEIFFHGKYHFFLMISENIITLKEEMKLTL